MLFSWLIKSTSLLIRYVHFSYILTSNDDMLELAEKKKKKKEKSHPIHFDL